MNPAEDYYRGLGSVVEETTYSVEVWNPKAGVWVQWRPPSTTWRCTPEMTCESIIQNTHAEHLTPHSDAGSVLYMTTTHSGYDYKRKNYPYNQYTTECYDGNGVDCEDISCLCPCHGLSAPNFLTVAEVIEWHKR